MDDGWSGWWIIWQLFKNNCGWSSLLGIHFRCLRKSIHSARNTMSKIQILLHFRYHTDSYDLLKWTDSRQLHSGLKAPSHYGWANGLTLPLFACGQALAQDLFMETWRRPPVLAQVGIPCWVHRLYFPHWIDIESRLWMSQRIDVELGQVRRFFFKYCCFVDHLLWLASEFFCINCITW